MSATSIQFKDQGYTSPDFLTNLFKKPLYSSYNLSSFDCNSPIQFKDSSLHSSTKQNQFPIISTSSLPQETQDSVLKLINIRNSPKLYRSHTLIDDDIIFKQKYKIFFKTVMDFHYSQQQINSFWQNLQKVIKDPFAFDYFLSQIRQKAQKSFQKQQKYCNQPQISIQQVKKKYAKSIPKKIVSQVIHPRFLSHSKPTKLIESQSQKQKNIRTSICQSIVFMKNTIVKGEKFIKQK